MKNLIFTLIFSVLSIVAFSQKISGTVENEENEKLSGAIVKLKNTFLQTVTDKNGKFEFTGLKKTSYTVIVSYIGYETTEKKIKINDSGEINIILKPSDMVADEVIVTANTANDKTPVAYTEISAKDIEKNNNARDLPYILELAPSVVTTSDAGAGVGYTSLRIRGTDMTRINVTLDGIPLNDPESHGVWWVDLPDLASSTDNIQIQRGVGTSVNGAGAFGANINIKTNKINREPFAELNSLYGSFNTFKSVVKTGTGMLNDKFAFDVRLSKIHSDGYIDRARSDLESFSFSGIYADKKNMIKAEILSGKEETYQAWYGVPKDSLVDGRTYNPYTYDNETDNYIQTHYRLFYTGEIGKDFILNIAFHGTQGKGYYEQYKENENFSDYGLDDVIIGSDTITDTDLIRRKWLDNIFVGTVYSLGYTKNKLKIIYGGSANYYDGDHFGRIIWARYASNSDIRYEWYRNNGIKKEFNNYVKLNYDINSKLNLWVDIQNRIINYEISGIHDDLRDISQIHDYNFLNPKAGFTYNFGENNIVRFSFAESNREPSRTNFRDASKNETVLPEKLYDFETGYKTTFNKAVFDLNFYYMSYKNQLILTGELNDVGEYIMSNVPESYRTGAEISGTVKPFDFFEWRANATFSKNKIKNLTVYVDNWDTWGQEAETYPETDISFSPSVIAGSEINFFIKKHFEASFITKYVGRQYIDNTSSEERSLDPYLVNNLRVSYGFKPANGIKDIGVNFYVNNIFNEIYESNAWVYRYIFEGKSYNMFGYYPQAGINFSAGFYIKF